MVRKKSHSPTWAQTPAPSTEPAKYCFQGYIAEGLCSLMMFLKHLHFDTLQRGNYPTRHTICPQKKRKQAPG